MKKRELDIQVRFADVDILGHINNVNLQHYYDLGKNDFFHEVLGMDTLPTRQSVITAATDTSYLAQTRMGENIYVETSVEKIGNKSLVLFQRIINRDTGEVKAESRSTMVAFDFEGQTSIPVPDEWRKAVE